MISVMIGFTPNLRLDIWHLHSVG